MKLVSNVIKVLVSLSLVISVGTTVYADPTEDSLNQQKQQLENQWNQDNQQKQKSELNAESARKDINNLNKQIQVLDSKIEGFNRTIADTKTKIAAKEAEIQEAQKNIEKAEAEIQREQVLLEDRMRAMYKGGGYNQYLSILLSSKDFNDLLSKVQSIEAIVNYDNKIIKDFSDKKEKLKADEAALSKDKDQLLAFKQDNENKLAEVQTSMLQQQLLVAEAKSRQAFYISQISDYKNKIAAEEKQVKETTKKLQELALAQSKNNQQNNRGDTPPAANAIVAYAYRFLGDPYVWGAEGGIFTQADIDMYRGTTHDLSGMEKLLGRQAFDCSGLMQYVYAHFGIYLKRTAQEQREAGTPVDKDNLKPGDLIFFGTYADTHHVGMYVGNNCYIEAPYSGEVVRISSLEAADEYLCARRIIN